MQKGLIELLEAARIDKALSWSGLANAFGVSERALFNFRNGITSGFQPAKIQAIAKGLGLTNRELHEAIEIDLAARTTTKIPRMAAKPVKGSKKNG